MLKENSLQDRRALVTGSTSGIGLAIARSLRAAGAEVILNGLGDPDEIAALCEELGASYNGANLMDPSAIEAMMGEIGAIDILVNNAGMQHVSPVEDFPVEKWNQVISLNLNAVFHTTRLAVPAMKEKGWGRIINTASAHSKQASPFKTAYVATKHAVDGFTKTIALELAQSGVTGFSPVEDEAWHRPAVLRHSHGSSRALSRAGTSPALPIWPSRVRGTCPGAR